MPPEDEVPTFDRVRDAVPSFDFGAVQTVIEKHFRVYQVERDVHGVPQGEVAAFYVMADPESFDRRFEAVRSDLRTLNPRLLVLLQHRLGEDVIIVTPQPPVRYGRGRLNVFLMVATILTTTLAGSLFWTGYRKLSGLVTLGGTDLSFVHHSSLLWGFLSFGLPLMLILGIHELGHWWIARRHRVRTSLPYFIPVPPPVPFGTFGAFISMKEPIPNRRALFDIGASGPIAGFLVTIPVLILGLVLTGLVAEQVPPTPTIHGALEAPDGTRWGFEGIDEPWRGEWERTGQVNLWVERIALDNATPGFAPGPGWRLVAHPVHLTENATVRFALTYRTLDADGVLTNHTLEGQLNLTLEALGADRAVTFSLPDNTTEVLYVLEWRPPPSGLFNLGESLLFIGLFWVVGQIVDIPEDVFLHPTAVAGWVGLLVTGFNLLPAGQLDGGHVARALFGEHVRLASYLSVATMFILSFWFAGWLLLAILVLLLGLRHPPPLNDRTELDQRRKAMALVVALILVVSFVPIPLSPLP